MNPPPHRPRVLMCRPSFFGVHYVINPWMRGQVGRADNAKALAQWQQLHDLLSTLAEVEVIEPGEAGRGLPDMVFSANAGLVLGDVFVPSVFRVPEREGEVPLFNRWFAGHGFEVRELPGAGDQAFEGEGDALFHPGQPLLWAGYGVRSGIDSHATLTELFNVEVVSLRLIDQRFYHLDTCFYPLPDGRVVYFAPAFDEPSRQAIERRIAPDDRIEVSEDDALRFTCNAVRLGETIVTNHAGAALQKRLNQWGYKVATCDVSEFMLAGGACKCMTLLLQQDLGPKADDRPTFASPIRTGRVALRGHLLDHGTLNKAMDIATDAGLGCSVEQFHPAERRDQLSTATLRITAPSRDRLDTTLAELMKMGAVPIDQERDATLCPVELPGVAPDGFYSTTIYPTDVRVDGEWVRATGQRMDAVIVVAGSTGVPPVSAESQGGTGVPPVKRTLSIHHRNLPHWQLGGSTYFITFRLLDGQLSDEDRRLVLDACLHWHQQRMKVHLATVMPDHVHLLVTPLQNEAGTYYRLEELLHSIKSFSAHELNKRGRRSGPVWQEEYFDRIVRDEDEFIEKWNYMQLNPVKAGLVQRPEDYAYTIAPDDHGRDARATSSQYDGRDARATENPIHGRDARATFKPSKPSARCVLMRDLMPGDLVVCHVGGVRVKTPDINHDEEFGFMSSSVSSERRVEQAVQTLAWEMQRIKARGGRIAVVAGPVVIHTGGGRHLENLIRHGYVQALLTGNALPVHDIEHSLFGTSLGVDLSRGVGVTGGHRHHLQAINLVRRAGSIKKAVEKGVITAGVMHACVTHGVDYVLAGSIRDDGPLPDTLMDLIEAQRAYAKAIEGCDMILMLSSMLHAIGTGNMTPAGVKLVCVDISPAVVTKLADRGSVESVGIVTDVGLLLNLLAGRLCA